MRTTYGGGGGGGGGICDCIIDISDYEDLGFVASPRWHHDDEKNRIWQ